MRIEAMETLETSYTSYLTIKRKLDIEDVNHITDIYLNTKQYWRATTGSIGEHLGDLNEFEPEDEDLLDEQSEEDDYHEQEEDLDDLYPAPPLGEPSDKDYMLKKISHSEQYTFEIGDDNQEEDQGFSEPNPERI